MRSPGEVAPGQVEKLCRMMRWCSRAPALVGAAPLELWFALLSAAGQPVGLDSNSTWQDSEIYQGVHQQQRSWLHPTSQLQYDGRENTVSCLKKNGRVPACTMCLHKWQTDAGLTCLTQSDSDLRSVTHSVNQVKPGCWVELRSVSQTMLSGAADQLSVMTAYEPVGEEACLGHAAGTPSAVRLLA